MERKILKNVKRIEKKDELSPPPALSNRGHRQVQILPYWSDVSLSFWTSVQIKSYRLTVT